MAHSTRLIIGSCLVATVVALAWLEAPLVPTVLGAFGTGLLLYWRARRAAV